MKRYTLEIEEVEDGQVSVSSKCDGFNAYELLGFLYWKISDVTKQIEGAFEPDIVKRELVEDNQ